jgi:hypothetical protein
MKLKKTNKTRTINKTRELKLLYRKIEGKKSQPSKLEW